MNLTIGQEVYMISKNKSDKFWESVKYCIVGITDSNIIIRHPNGTRIEIDKYCCKGTLFETKKDADNIGIKYMGSAYRVSIDKSKSEDTKRSDMVAIVDKINNMQQEIYSLFETLCSIKFDVQDLLEEEHNEDINNR